MLFVSNYYVESCELLDTSLSGYLGENSDIIIPFSSPATAYERCKLGNFPINDNDNLSILCSQGRATLQENEKRQDQPEGVR